MLNAPHSLATVFVRPITPALAYKQPKNAKTELIQTLFCVCFVCTSIIAALFPYCKCNDNVRMQPDRHGKGLCVHLTPSG